MGGLICTLAQQYVAECNTIATIGVILSQLSSHALKLSSLHSAHDRVGRLGFVAAADHFHSILVSRMDLVNLSYDSRHRQAWNKCAVDRGG